MSLTIRFALVTFSIGFAIEGATEGYQFLSYGYLHTAWVGFYYIGLITTGAGFYLMYRGRHEWTSLHHRSVLRGHRFAWTAAALFGGAVLAIALVAMAEGPSSTGSTPLLLVALVGAAVALAFGNFFLGLVLLVRHLVRPWAQWVAWAAFVWSLGVAVLTGIVVGREFPSLLVGFFSDPLGLVVSFAPLAFTMAPLFVSYGLFTVAYLDAADRVRKGLDQADLPPGTDLTSTAPQTPERGEATPTNVPSETAAGAPPPPVPP